MMQLKINLQLFLLDSLLSGQARLSDEERTDTGEDTETEDTETADTACPAGT